MRENQVIEWRDNEIIKIDGSVGIERTPYLIDLDTDVATEVAWMPQPGSQEAFLTCPVFEVLYEGTRGPGKGLPLTEPVMTPLGPKPMGELKVGSLISCPDGTNSRVVGYYPQGKRPCFELTFEDGSVARCDDQHMWATRTYLHRWKYDQNYLVEPITEIIKWFNKGYRVKIPTLVRYENENPRRFRGYPVDPYLMGLLMGDASMSGRFTVMTIHPQLWDEFKKAGATEEKCLLPRAKRFKFIGNTKILKVMEDNGLDKYTALTAKIPDIYLKANYDTRLALLQGMFDMEGIVTREGKVDFYTFSPYIADAVQQLVRSLGGIGIRTESYTKLLDGRGYQSIKIRVETGGKFMPFRLPARIKKLANLRREPEELWLEVKSIHQIEDQESACIKISHPKGLFLTRDYVVTHNTDALLVDFLQDVGRGWGADWRGVLFRQSFPQLSDVINKSQKLFRKIFPGAEYNKQDHVWTFPEGEQLLLRHMADPEDYWNFHGHAYPWIGWEELTNWPDDVCYRRMMSCSRSVKSGMPRKYRATTNPYGCVPYGDVLTADRGWVDIRNIIPGDKVLSVNSSGETVVAEVSGITAAAWNGEIIERKGRGINMLFTPTHRFPHLDTEGKNHTVKGWEELPGQALLRRTGNSWKGIDVDTILGFDPHDFMKLLGWFVSEGCMISRKDNSERNSFQITQTKEYNVKIIKDLLTRMGLHHRYGTDSFVVTHPILADIFRPLGNSWEKYIPHEYLSLSTPLLQSLLDALMAGDGHHQTYYTTSPKLRDNVEEIAAKLGYPTNTATRNRPGKRESYSVSMSLRSRKTQINTGNHQYGVDSVNKSVNVEKYHFEGMVYCITVPGTETFYIRQNGCVWLSGNTGHHWVKLRWRLPEARGRIIRDSYYHGEKEPPRVAIHGKIYENQILLKADPEYIAKISAAARNANELAAWIDGSWDITAGGMFDDIWRGEVHVLQKFDLRKIPKGWKITRSYDHGQSKPFSVGWHAESNGEPLRVGKRIYGAVRGDMIRIAEWYGWTGEPNVGLRMETVEIGQGIRDREEDMGLLGRVRPGPADGSIFDPKNRRKDIASILAAECGGFLASDKSAGSRKHGWEQMRKFLKGAIPDIETGERDTPGYFILETCEQFKRTIPTIPRNDDDLDDIDTDAEDHIADEVRYYIRKKVRTVRGSSG